MKITATKSQESAQFEVFLKLKQQDNVDFQFLQQNHELHPFFQWLKDPKTGKCDDSSSTNTHLQAIQLLEMYSFSSDDKASDDDDEIQSSKTTSNPMDKDQPTMSDMVKPDGMQSHTKEEKRLERLKRAKMLRHHFATR
jgi:hypothetical protein